MSKADSETMPNATTTALKKVIILSSPDERRASVMRDGMLPVSAAIGLTRRARRAGQTADTAVTPTPTKIAARIELVLTTMGASGSPAPKLPIIHRIPREMRTPKPRPAALATTPTAIASPTTMAVTCRPLAPKARSSPSSRVRWLTRMVNVLWMMKADTTRITTAKPSMKYSKKPMNWSNTSACSSTRSSLATTSKPSSTTAATAAEAASGEVLGSSRMSMLSKPPPLCSSCRAVSVSHAVICAPAVALSPVP